MRQKASSSQHSAFLIAKNHWLNANCSKEVCKLVDVHPERLMGRTKAFHQQCPELHRAAVAAIFVFND